MNQLLFPEGWERPLEDKDHANPEPAHPARTARAPSIYTNQRSNAAGAARKGPCLRGQKRPCTPGRGSAGSWRWARLLHGSISLPSRAHPHRIRITSPSASRLCLPPCRRPRHAHAPPPHPPHACEQVRLGQLSTLEALAAARLLGQGAPCPSHRRPAPRTTRPPPAAHAPLSLATGADLPMVVLLYY